MSEQPVACRGAVAAGHPVTAAAATEILEAGGNAFDAIIAAHFAACVAEPVLASLGGGGYLVARCPLAEPVVYDFFVQTPGGTRTEAPLDFFPIQADFGTVCQEFHIGFGSVAVPGSVKGMFEIHRDLGSLPMTRLVEPAIRAARKGIRLNRLQAQIFQVISPIYKADPEVSAHYGKPGSGGGLVGEGDLLRQPLLAETLATLAGKSDDWFYRGELADTIARLCREKGGYLTRDDLAHYQVIRRKPLEVCYRDTRFYANAPPAAGGLLIAFALDLLERFDPGDLAFGSARHLDLLARVMEATNQARAEQPKESLLDPRLLELYRQKVAGRARCNRGTTHISVMDDRGNMAAMTVSNGEGCGRLIPGTGIMLNNMLGEEDLNPGGFHRWRPGERMASMMTPGLLYLPAGKTVVLGSGGSNRIRTAILQVISNLVDFGMTPEQAVSAPRIHFESGHLDIEPGYPPATIAALAEDFPDHRCWREQNLFFGGVHTVEWDGRRFHGVGDPRRGGVGRRAKAAKR